MNEIAQSKECILSLVSNFGVLNKTAERSRIGGSVRREAKLGVATQL